jgi:protoporphyrinogen IX oxidase
MIGWLGNAYPWVKAAHLIFVIFWMAGLFMLPRFFIYHQEAEPNSPEALRWVDRERRLLRIILNPSMIIVWVLGLALVLNIGAFQEGWFHAKFVMVLLLSGYHGWMSGYARKLAAGTPTIAGKKLRLLNEIPGIAATIIVILAIVKPF